MASADPVTPLSGRGDLSAEAGQESNAAPPPPPAPEADEEGARAEFECNICLDTARDAVISLCGHLFCWPCLHQWLETRPQMQICPVCKAGISQDKVIPLYGRGNTDRKDPRDKVPPRPKGQRPEPESQNAGAGFFSPFGGFTGGGNGGFHMSFGIGAFPFGLFTNLNLADPRARGATGSVQHQEEVFLNKVFLMVAMAFVFWLLIA
eukprot:snap_masked-scaffold294_size218657-processed-gene-1.5 protein:Tk10439 transcript:snap_masked-scaffold294_size218657-processed-gene-1.5-mRNA-1 annotation:"ring finger"